MKQPFFRTGLGIFIVLSFLSLASALPENKDDDIQALRQKVEELEQRLEKMEAGSPSVAPQSGGPSFGVPLNNDPFSELRRMQETMEQMFDDFHRRYPQTQQGSSGPTPLLDFDNQADIKETDNAYEIRLDLSGLDKDKVDVAVNPHSVTITGEVSREEKQTNPGGSFQAKSFGSFLKTIPLPVDADTSKVKTAKKGDTLVLTVPKKKQ